jgi:periplasmic protein TonB
MTAENILKSDVLDIVFENRNKAYGAYYIRKHYNGYLLKGLLTALLFVVLSFWIAAFKPEKAVAKVFTATPDTVVLISPPLEPPPPPPPPSAKQLQVAAQKASTYRIMPTDQPVTQPIPDIIDLIDKKIGLNTLDGVERGDIVTPERGEGTQAVPVDKIEEPEHTGPFDVAMVDEAAEYPGGLKAMMIFLLRNLHGGEEITERLKVKVQFIVGEDGRVKDCRVLQSAGENIDQQVLKALRKMPTWKPARKNGKEVAMYFVQPVVFDIADN